MEKIPCQLIRSRWRTLGLELRPEGLVVRAPLRATNRQIEYFVEQHRQWIRQHREKLERQKRQAAALPPLTGAELQELAERARRYIPERGRYYAPRVGGGLQLHHYPLPEVPGGQLFRQGEPQLQLSLDADAAEGHRQRGGPRAVPPEGDEPLGGLLRPGAAGQKIFGSYW